jgi:hypothetical protein
MFGSPFNGGECSCVLVTEGRCFLKILGVAFLGQAQGVGSLSSRHQPGTICIVVN